jgi:aspartate aminotransferase
MTIRSAIRNLEPNGIAKVSLLGLGARDIVPLWFGESDLVTPAFIREAAKQALDDGVTFYDQARGMKSLRQALCDYHKRVQGVDVAVERISLPGAATLAVVTALQCLVETGDNVVIVSPIWPSIFQAAQVVGAELRFARLKEDWSAGKWRLDLDLLFSLCDGRTRAIFVCSPGNPTGWMATREELQAILDFSRARGIAIIGDEVYGTLVYDGRPHAPSFLEIAAPDDALFVVNSFSKPWAMTGWRIGWLIHPPALAEAMEVMTIANNTGPTVFAQHGAIAALSPQGDAFRAEMLERCRAGREIVQRFLDGHNRARWIKPDGAFYGFVQIEGLKDSLAFAQDLVRRERLGVSPGMAFGPSEERENESYLRLCFAQDPALLSEGLSRLEKGLSAL